jgi:hypothetical protein
MSTRTHWLRPIDKRITACGRNAFQSDIFEGSAAEYLGVSNFCVKCERAAQKAEALSVLRAFGSGKPKSLPAPPWPKPRPIAEAPNTAILAWCPATEELTEGWEVVYPSNQPGWWCGNGELHQPTHFLPLPPAPEVRK